jgi:xanthine dehydrogenase accessory factor
MRDIVPELSRWRQQGIPFAVATVVETWGSSPRPAGSAMGIRKDGLVCGSVSGGCIESAVIEAAMGALEDGKPRDISFDRISPESLWQIGLSCGGAIRVWVNPVQVPEVWAQIESAVSKGRTIGLRSCLATGAQEVLADASPAVEVRDGYLGQTLTAKDRMIVFGASHLAIPLVTIAKVLGFEVTVVDPRTALMRPERFPDPPDRLLESWPEEAIETIGVTPQTYAVMLSHDPKIDDAALRLLLRSPAAYLGALGSKQTQNERRRKLAEAGFTEEELRRIRGPVGLDIGARTPEEIAVSIAAEIVQTRNAHR